MSTICIFFGTGSGSTRLVAEKVAEQLKLLLTDGRITAWPDEILPELRLSLGPEASAAAR